MRLQRSALAVGILLVTASAAAAQTDLAPSRQVRSSSSTQTPLTGPIVRSDVSGTVGWFNADKGELSEYDDWYNRSIFGGVSFGWYWTDNLKTEIEAGASSRAERDIYVNRQEGSRFTNFESTYHFATRRIAIGQQYQFFRNAWFHPYVGAGVDLTWETIDHEDSPVTVYDTSARNTVEIRPARTFPRETPQHTRPFAGFGFKSYMTPRSFFRSDVKMVFHDGVDEVLLRMGFGVDF
jgi:outer membrane protein W